MDKKKELIVKLATEFHQSWRDSFKRKNGNYFKDFEVTKDRNYIKKNKDKLKYINNSYFVDIANLSFEQLPFDWQKENLEAAHVVIDLLYSKKNLDFSIDQIEEISNKVHLEWIKRNKDDENKKLLLDYNKLSESEREKDKFQVLKGIELLKKERKRSR